MVRVFWPGHAQSSVGAHLHHFLARLPATPSRQAAQQRARGRGGPAQALMSRASVVLLQLPAY